MLGRRVGSITKHGGTSLQYTVKSLKDLNIIIDHFDKYPLIMATQKNGLIMNFLSPRFH